MTLRGYAGIDKQNITATLKLGVRIIKDSGVADILQEPMTARAKRGRPAELPQYTALSVLATWFQLTYANQPVTFANISRCHWDVYTPQQLQIIGLPADWRDPARKASMRFNRNIVEQEYHRLHDFLVDLLEPMDDTPFQASKNPTIREAKDGRKANEELLAPKTALRDQLINAIVGASIDPTLFEHYRANVSVDLHNIGIVKSRDKEPTAPHKTKAGPPLADYWYKHRRLAGAFVIGLTCAIPNTEPGEPRVPDVALGIGIGQPAAADPDAALVAIDAADAHPVTKATGSNTIRWVVGDQAYQHAKDFNEKLNDRKRSLLMEYRYKSIYDIHVDPDDTDCVHFTNGVLLCPAARAEFIRNANLRARSFYDGDDKQRLQLRKEDLDVFEAARMPTNGRAKKKKKRKPGRPRKTTTETPDIPAEDVYKIEAYCPARRGKCRCTRYEPSLSLATPHLFTPDENTTSYACHGGANAKVTIELTRRQFKDYSPLMLGTFEHWDFYKTARSHNEGYHTMLVGMDFANLRDHAIRSRRNSSVCISIALAVAVANIYSQDAFIEARKNNGGVAPEGQRTRIQRRRNQLLSA